MPAAQKPDSNNKADAASPFAILVQDAAPKGAAKTVHKDTHASDDKKDGDTPPVKKDDKAAATAQAKPVQKADKPEKGDDKTAKADDAADTNKTDKTGEAAAQDQTAQPQQAAQSQMQAQAQPPAALAAANDDETGAEEIAGAAEIQDTKAAQAAQPSQDKPAPQDAAKDAQLGQDAGKTLNAQPGAKPAKGDAKNQTKPADIKAAKADAADTAAASAADAKAAAANAALNDKPAAPQDAGRQANADTGMAVHSLAAPQGQQQAPANAPVTTQHVQVTPQPTPNVPALAVEIAAKSQSGAKQFDIRLDPPELGRVEVRLSIDAAGKASAHLSADQQQTLDLLQKDAPALTRALRDAGLDVSQDGLNFSLRHQNSDSSAGNNGGNRGNGRGFSLNATNTIEATATSAAYRSVADGRLDIRV